MQIVFLPLYLTLPLIIILWPLMQYAASWLSKRLPARFFRDTTGFFSCHRWEKDGAIYQRVFRIRKWKHLLPDGGAMVGGYAKKHLTDFSRQNLETFIEESCRAEFSHWVAMLPFWVFGFFAEFAVIYFMLAYAIVVNLPCILAQRFNRPRIHKVLARTP